MIRTNKNYQRVPVKLNPAMGVLVLLAVLIASPVRGQPKSHIGIVAGIPTGASMTGSYIEGSDGLELGIFIGAWIDREFNDRWAFLTGITYVQKGGKKLQLAGGGDNTYGYQTAYLQVPLLARAAFPISGGPWYIAPYAGLAVGLGLSCKVKPGDQFEFEDECDETTPGGNLATLEISVPFGTYLWHRFEGGSRVHFVFGFDVGLTNVFGAAQEAGLSARNQVVVFIGLGFAVPLY